MVSELKLSGAVRADGAGMLGVANCLYERLFDDAWVRLKIPVDRARLVAAGTVAASLLALVVWFAVVAPQAPIDSLELAIEDYAVAEQAYAALSKNALFSQARADELFAQFWDRRARADAFRGDRDGALLAWLRALGESDSDQRRRTAAHLVGSDWDWLSATLRHDSLVLAVAFSPDGKTVLTGSDDGSARLWRADTGALLGEPLRHDSLVRAVAFSPDGRAIVQTSNWLHISSATPDGLQPIESRLSRAIAFHFPEGCDPCDEVTVAVRPTDRSVRIEMIRLDFQDEEPLAGDPADLLNTWQERLALVFDVNGRLIPRWPIPAPREPRSGDLRSGDKADRRPDSGSR